MLQSRCLPKFGQVDSKPVSSSDGLSMQGGDGSMEGLNDGGPTGHSNWTEPVVLRLEGSHSRASPVERGRRR